MNTIIIYLLLLLNSGLKETEKFVPSSDLCVVLSEMAANDQKYRDSRYSITDYLPKVLDSLILSKGITKEAYANLYPEEQSRIKIEALKISRSLIKPMMAENDSLRKLQWEIDDQNTALLIDIVKQHGWVDSKNLKCEQQFHIFTIFRHSRKKYWKKIRTLIEKEREAKRLPEYEYYLIDNHLQGRPQMKKKSLEIKMKE